ncbi:hypothetical protein HU200_047457 [Digitaria exilis]|uniref:Uncharacterized protein n=1 Tax=Digitaria exilis TaxID=1010633 RepID=A0A835B8E1_9POAL|nr:hypothetical protein HU200_047457 [Digitaria exilis]
MNASGNGAGVSTVVGGGGGGVAGPSWLWVVAARGDRDQATRSNLSLFNQAASSSHDGVTDGLTASSGSMSATLLYCMFLGAMLFGPNMLDRAVSLATTCTSSSSVGAAAVSVEKPSHDHGLLALRATYMVGVVVGAAMARPGRQHGAAGEAHPGLCGMDQRREKSGKSQMGQNRLFMEHLMILG